MNNEEIKTLTLNIPHDFEGGIYVGRNDKGVPVFILVHRDDGDSLPFPPKNYVYPSKYDDNLGDAKVTAAQVF